MFYFEKVESLEAIILDMEANILLLQAKIEEGVASEDEMLECFQLLMARDIAKIMLIEEHSTINN